MKITSSRCEQRVVLRRRLLLEHVERRAARTCRSRAPRAARASSTMPPRAALMTSTPGFAFANASRPISPRVLSVSGTCSVIDVGAREQLVERDELDAETLARAPRRRADRTRSRACAGRARGPRRSSRCCRARSTPSTWSKSSLPLNLVFSHLPGAHAGGRLRDLARERRHQRDRVLGGRDRVALGRVHHDDAARGRRGEVDVVDADARRARSRAASWPPRSRRP